MISIPTDGADIHILNRPCGGWKIFQGGAYILITPDEARKLSKVLAEISEGKNRAVYTTCTPAQYQARHKEQNK